MAWIRALDSGLYQAAWRDPTNRVRTRVFRRKTDARSFLKELEAQKVKGLYHDPGAGRIVYREWADRWWATTANLRPSTRERDGIYMASYVRPRFDDMPVGAIGQLDVRGWVADLSARGLAAATVAKAYQLFAKTMSAAVDAGLIAQSPCRNIPLPRIEREETRFLSPAEVARLADTIDARYRALVLVAAYGGLRIGELAGLRPERVDLLRGTVDVAEIVVEVNGVLHAGPPKTRAGRRRVALPRPVVDELADHLGRHERDHVFPAPGGGPLRVPAFRSRVWRPAVTAAGLAPLRIHDLRHTAVALWIAASAGPKEIAAKAGHQSVSTVLDRYGHLYDDQDAEVRDRLSAMFDAGRLAARDADVVEIADRGSTQPGG